MKKVFLLHGMSCRLDETFGVWLKDELSKINIKYIEPLFTLGMKLTFESWKIEMDKFKDFISEQDIFICHSLSTNFIIKYFAKNKLNCDMLICVAGGLRDAKDIPLSDRNFLEFVPSARDFAYCRKNIKRRFNIFNVADNIWTQQEIRNYTKELSAEGIELSYGGHFGRSSKVKEIPEIMKIISSD